MLGGPPTRSGFPPPSGRVTPPRCGLFLLRRSQPIASIDDVRSYTQSSQFALTAYGRTPLSAVLDLVLFDVDGKPWVPDSHEWVLEQGLDLASNDRRDFAFLHVLSPHEPYYFDERCNVVAEYRHESMPFLVEIG